MKLELKVLAAYLPHGLKITDGSFVYTMTLSDNNGERIKLSTVLDSGFHFKPILRPMSDLNKEIIFDDDKISSHFVPMEVLGKLFEMNMVEYCFLSANAENFKLIFDSVRYCVMQKLIAWRFDVFGLINNGLAIDINTLKE